MIIWFVVNSLLWAMDCQDYDQGKNPVVASSVLTSVQNCSNNRCLVNQIVDRDSCMGANKVLEYYCEGNKSVYIIMDCPDNKVCNNGSCQ